MKTTQNNQIIDREIEFTEKLKEFHRMQFDYFKLLTTLSSGSVLVMLAFLNEAFNIPKVGIIIILICFMTTLVSSLIALPSFGNVIMYITMFQKAIIDEKIGEIAEAYEKICQGNSNLKIIDNISRWAFVAGILSIIFFAIFCN